MSIVCDMEFAKIHGEPLRRLINVILQEVAGVLSMQLASIDSFSWLAEGIQVETRCHVPRLHRYGNHHRPALSIPWVGCQVGIYDAAKSPVWKHDQPFY
jgi:hypothetical protein